MRRDDHAHSRRFFSATLVALVALASSCNWLSGPKLDSDPNRSVNATRDQLLVGVQLMQFTQQGSVDLQVDVSLWMQQLTAVSLFFQTTQLYQYGPGAFSWSQTYAHGGLLDVRKIEASARDAHDSTYLGIAQVWEALIIGQAADMFGDIPYSEAAADIASPKLDSQSVVYGALQRLLDSAITNLASNEGVGPPASVDLVYGDDPAKWIQAAHSLKARLFMHTAERDPAAYGEALIEAEQGISSAAGDFLGWHSETPNEVNPWFSVSVDGESNVELAAGKVIVDMMKSRNDPRLRDYFTVAGNGQYLGASPGDDFDASVQSQISATRGAKAFRQPILTWAETRLIEAEAQYRAGRENEARSALNVERASVGLSPVGASGSGLLIEILQEKYIALFQSPEVWNDYKRTCYPNLTPVSQAQGGNIPPRYLYDERGVNPNIPADPIRNWNDPVTALAPDGSPCLGQRS
jgi:starch-binding outer membrane protein, SusD/RagB family